MSRATANRAAKAKREDRLPIVANLYKKGYSYDQIRKEVMDKTGVKTYSKSTVHKDVQILLTEWRENRLKDTDLAIQAELEKINLQEQELWIAWEKSKLDQKSTSKKQKGIAAKQAAVGKGGLTSTDKITTTAVEKIEKEEINYGDVRYQEAINRLGIERRKLLGLYAAEKKEITGKDGSPVFNGFDAFMANCLDLADNDKELNEAAQQETTDSTG